MSGSLTPEIIVVGFKSPNAAKPSPVLLVYQGFLVEEAQAAIDAALSKGTIDSARTYRGRQGNYIFLPQYCADRPVPVGT